MNNQENNQESNQEKNNQDVSVKNNLRAVMETENLKIQEAEWVEREIQRQREIEDEIRERLGEEQKLLDEKKRSIEENMERTRQLKKYNDERRKELNGQVYGLYGISDDRLEGIESYKDGSFKGCAVVMFVISLAMVIFTGLMYGFSSQLSLFLIAGLAVQGALIPRSGERSVIGNGICAFLYFVSFAAEAVIFVAFEAGFMQNYKFALPYVAIGIVALTVVGVISYFIYNPYAKFRSGIRQARKDLKRISQTAEKNVRKNMKLRKKQEEKEEKLRRKEAKLEEKRIKQGLLSDKSEAVKTELPALEAKPEIQELKAENEDVKAEIEKAKEEAIEVKPETIEVKEEAIEVKPETIEVKPEAAEVKAEIQEVKSEAEKEEAEALDENKDLDESIKVVSDDKDSKTDRAEIKKGLFGQSNNKKKSKQKKIENDHTDNADDNASDDANDGKDIKVVKPHVI